MRLGLVAFVAGAGTLATEIGASRRTVLVIGDAGGTIPRAYGRLYPGIAIDGVELDPVVTSSRAGSWR